MILMADSSCQASLNVKPLKTFPSSSSLWPGKLSHSLSLCKPSALGDSSRHRVSLSLVLQSVVLAQPQLHPLRSCLKCPALVQLIRITGSLRLGDCQSWCFLHTHASHMDCEVVLGQLEPYSTLGLWCLEQHQVYSVSAIHLL